MKKILAFLLIFSCVVTIFACTSFVLNDGEMVRGMNFDYFDDPPMSLWFSDDGDENAFFVSFHQYAVTMGLNESGVFSTLQALNAYPVPEYTANSMGIADAFTRSVLYYEDVSQLMDDIADFRLIMPPMYIHMLTSDMKGNAYIVEVTKEQNEITEKTSKVFVMANFLNYKFRDKEHMKVYGPSSARYKKMYNELLECETISNYEEGFESMKASRTVDTEFSILFFPERKTAYITFDGNYDRVWKLDVVNRVLSTEKGFEESRTYSFEGNPISKEELVSWQ